MTAPMPGPNGPGVSSAGGASLVIFSHSQTKPAAWAADGVPVALGGSAALLRAHRQHAAAALDLAVLDAHQLAVREGVPDAARSRALAAEGAGVGADRAGDAHWQPSASCKASPASIEACVALDRKTDEILEKRRWMMDKATEAKRLATRHEKRSESHAFRSGYAARRVVVRRAGADRDRRVLLPAGARRARDEPHRLRPVRAERFRRPALRSASRTTRACCASRCSGRRSATRFYFVALGVPLSIAASLGAALARELEGREASAACSAPCTSRRWSRRWSPSRSCGATSSTRATDS